MLSHHIRGVCVMKTVPLTTNAVSLTVELSVFLLLSPSQECVLAGTGVQDCVLSSAPMTVTAPVMRSAATTDVDMSALHRTQWSRVAAPCPREPPCVLNTAITMVSVQESRSAARQPAATPAASPADWTETATRLHVEHLFGFSHATTQKMFFFYPFNSIVAHVCSMFEHWFAQSRILRGRK